MICGTKHEFNAVGRLLIEKVYEKIIGSPQKHGAIFQIVEERYEMITLDRTEDGSVSYKDYCIAYSVIFVWKFALKSRRR